MFVLFVAWSWADNQSMTAHRTSPFDWLIAETLVMSIIGLNALVLFLEGFPSVSETTGGLLGWVDYACLLYFIVEAFIVFANSFLNLTILLLLIRANEYCAILKVCNLLIL